MKLYTTNTSELSKTNPTIEVHNLNADGLYIGIPGTLIFRSKQELWDACEKAKKIIREGKI